MQLIKRHPSIGYALFQIGFWSVVFLLNVGPEWHKYSSLRELVEVVGTTTILQALVASAAVIYLVPHWLDRRRVAGFAVMLFGTLMLAAEINILISYFYLERAYPTSYGAYYLTNLADMTLKDRIGFSYLIKYILFSKVPSLAFPAAILIAINYYRRQQTILQLREQKRVAELEALKNQLNPHFIFNTLNNIYALAILGSKQTAEAIAKLSGIFDYVLYRCNDTQVSLDDEIAMIEDYIALEKLRFGDRLSVSFKRQSSTNSRVAPLLFLTLMENAFKHGTTQELKQATISLNLLVTEGEIKFKVSNTKPDTASLKTSETGIGLKNLRRQLDLVYPNMHQLQISETKSQFTVTLIISRRKLADERLDDVRVYA